MLRHNLKLALRKFFKNKLHSFISVASFTFGIAICLTIGLYIQHELNVDTCFKNHDQIFRMINVQKGHQDKAWMDYNEVEILRESYPEIESVCPMEMHTSWKRQINTSEKSLYMDGWLTTDNSFFGMFSIPILQKMSEQPFSNINSAVLTESTAKQMFGKQNPIGQSFIIDAKHECVVSAVVPDFPANASISGKILLNAENTAIRSSHCGDGKGGWFYAVNTFLQLSENTSATELSTKINDALDRLHLRPERIKLQALDNIYLAPRINGTNNRTGNAVLVFLFSTIGILILTLSVINHINFVTSHQLTRLKEIGIKKTAGANVIQLMMYFLVEFSLLLIISILVAIMLVEITLPYTNQLFNRLLSVNNLATIPFIASIIMIAIFMIITSSLIPTFMISKFEVRNYLSGQFGNLKKNTTKRILTTAQFVISIILLISAFTIQKQINYIKHKDFGFNKENLLWLKLPTNYQYANALKNKLLQYPAIQNASISRGNPGYINYNSYVDGVDGNSFRITRFMVDDNFLQTFGLTLIAGRTFHNSDLGKSCLISETTFKKCGWKNFDGRKFENFDVIGVVSDFDASSMHELIEGIILAYSDEKPTSLSLRIKTDNMTATMNDIREAWQNISRNSPFEYQFYDEMFDAMYRDDERLSKTIALFCLIAFVITCIGLFSQSFQTCVNRTKEIGVRKVLGASVSTITYLLTKDFAKQVIIANLIAWPIVWCCMQLWLQNFVYRVEMSWWMFALAGSVSLVITLLSVGWQAIRAATANPVEALRYE